MKLFRALFKPILLTALLTFNLCTKAQDLQHLDLVKGISIFKFRTDTSHIKDREIKISTAKEMKKVGYYRYTGDSLKTFFGIPVDEVSIYYYENKLFRIDINFGTKTKEYSLQAYHQVQQQLEKAYGTEKTKLAMSGAVLLGGFAWNGKKVNVDHTRYSSPPKRKKDNPIYGGVSFSDVAITRQSITGVFKEYMDIKDSVIHSLPKGAEKIGTEAGMDTYRIGGYKVFLNPGDAKVAPGYLAELKFGLHSKTLAASAKYYRQEIKKYKEFEVLVNNMENENALENKIWFFCVNNTNERCFNGYIEYPMGERLSAEKILAEMLSSTKFK